MPHNQDTPTNQTPNPSPEETAATPAQPEKLKVVFGGLQKALMRTFRQDVSTTLNTTNQEEIESYLPHGARTSTPAAPTPPTPPSKAPKDAIVHTLGDDVHDLVQNQKMSLVRMAALESNKNKHSQKATQKDPWKLVLTVLLAVLAVVIVAVLGAAGYYAYRLNATATAPAASAGIIFTEGREPIDVGGQSIEALKTLFGALHSAQIFTLGSMTELNLRTTPKPTSLTDYPQPRTVSIYEWLEILDARVPQSFIDTLSDAYMFGVHTTDAGNESFMILTTTSYSYAFSGMLAWEKNITTDLSSIFIPAQKVARGSFVDSVIDNLDVRILYGADGSELLVYGFINRTSIVLTTNSRTYLDIAERLRIQR